MICPMGGRKGGGSVLAAKDEVLSEMGQLEMPHDQDYCEFATHDRFSN
jgi:hypothetical protein